MGVVVEGHEASDREVAEDIAAGVGVQRAVGGVQRAVGGERECAEDAGIRKESGESVAKSPAEVAPTSGLFLKSYLVTVSRSGPRARPEPPSPSPDLGLRMDRATGPASPSPVAHPHYDGGGGWPKVTPVPITRSDRDDLEEDEGDKSAKTKRKKKKRKKEPKEGGGGKWTFGGLFRRKKKKEEELECTKDSTEEDYGVEKFSPAKGVVFPPSPSMKRHKNEEYPSERLAHPCAMHNGCVGCVVTGRPGRSRQRPVFGSGSDCRDSYGGTSLVRRDSSTSSHRERKELIKARVEAMRERLPKDSSSEDECLPGGSEGSWEWRGRKIPLPVSGVPAGGVGSAGSSPYLGRRSRFVARTERFHQRRISREFRDEGEEEEMWRRRGNGLPPQCVPWRASQSDVEAPYIGGRMTSANSGTTTELGGSAMSYSPAQSPLQSPVLSGRRSARSTTSPGYSREPTGLPYHGGNRCVPRRYPSTPLSQQGHLVEGPTEGRHVSAHAAPHYPMRSRSTDVLHSWRPEDGSYHGSEPSPFHYPVKQPATQRPTQEPPQFHQRWPLANSGRSPPPPPPPRDPQRRITNPQSLSHFQMHEQAPPSDGYVRKHYPKQPPFSQVQKENPYMNVQNPHVHQSMQGGSHQQGVTCLADSQPRSRRPLRVTAGAYAGRTGEMSYMSDSQVGPNMSNVRRTLTQHPPLESHYAIPFLADSPPPRCVINRVIREPQLAESVVHNPRPLMRQQRAPVFSRSRSSSPAPSVVNNRPALLPLRPFENSNDTLHFSPRGHSSAPQTPIEGPINRPLSIVSEEKGEISAKVPPVPPARSSSRRSSVSSLEAIEYGMWGMDRNSRQPSKGPSGLEDALTELENIYKSLKFEDDIDGETDSVLMGSSETGATYDDQDRPLTDDMAYRRLHSKEKAGGQQGVGGVVAQAGSYLLVSPTLGPADPWTEPPPNSINPGEPDVTLDDVVFRSIRQANAHMPPDPQPPFGIPIGPVTRAPDSDYLHAKPPSPCPTTNRSSSSARKTPDLVKDDLAFRSLRKDRPTNGIPIRPVPLRGVTSPPPRPSSSFSCVSSPPPLPNTGIDFQAIRKKRAVRSLSANLLGILQNTSLTTRPLSPPPATKLQLPPPSPTSPRKELKNIVFSPTPIKNMASSPLKNKPVSPPVLASEDSETNVNEAPAPGNDATSSDTLTDGHADEPKKKNKALEDIEMPEEFAPPVPKNSPGEVYEALGRVLSRVGKDTSYPGKSVQSKGDDDDLETLFVALAREARTTSENLGRELDQLRTSAGRSPDVTKKQERVDAVVVKEFDASSPASPKKVNVITEVVDRSMKEGKPLHPVTSPQPIPAPRIGAIASLARIDGEKTRSPSFVKVKDQGKGAGLSVVVGKCTVGRDSNQPGVVSFTSSVGPLSPSAVPFESEMEKLQNVSTPSAEDPMKAGGADVTVIKDSDKSSMVSTESAKVPIKSGSMGFVVMKESGKNIDSKFENSEKSASDEVKTKEKTGEVMKSLKNCSKMPVGFASAVMKHSEHVKPHVAATPKEPVKSITLQSKSERMEVNAAPKPISEQTSTVGFVFGKESDQSINTEIAPITASMKLVVRRNAEGLPHVTIPPPFSPRKTELVAKQESEGITTEPKEATPQFAVASTQTNGIKNINDGDEMDLSVTHESDVSPEKVKDQNSESMSPGTVVESIQKDFDQIFAIPAKKPRKSDVQESPEISGVNRSPATKPRSLEQPKQTGSVEQLKKALPKSPASIKETKPSVEEGDKVRKSDVTCVFEKEFDELWKATNTTKKTEELLDSELERELDQLCSVKMDSQEAVVGMVVGAVVPKGSPEASAQGLQAEGEVCSSASSGSPEDSEKTAACSLKPAVASPACLTLGIYRPQTISANASLDPSVISSMVSGFYPEDGDPLFTALAAILALVSFVAALLVRP